MKDKKGWRELQEWKSNKDQDEIDKYGATLEEISKYDTKSLDKLSKIIRKVIIAILIGVIIIFGILICVTVGFLMTTFGRL